MYGKNKMTDQVELIKSESFFFSFLNHQGIKQFLVHMDVPFLILDIFPGHISDTKLSDFFYSIKNKKNKRKTHKKKQNYV